MLCPTDDNIASVSDYFPSDSEMVLEETYFDNEYKLHEFREESDKNTQVYFQLC